MAWGGGCQDGKKSAQLGALEDLFGCEAFHSFPFRWNGTLVYRQEWRLYESGLRKGGPLNIFSMPTMVSPTNTFAVKPGSLFYP